MQTEVTYVAALALAADEVNGLDVGDRLGDAARRPARRSGRAADSPGRCRPA